MGRNDPSSTKRSNKRYVTALRERLDSPTTWKEVMNVTISDIRTLVNATLSTESATSSLTRGTAYTFSDFTLTADTLTISTGRVIPMFIDEADRNQQAYFGSPEIARFQGQLLDEWLETDMLAQHASWRDFGVGDLNNTSSNDTTLITVSATNVDDIIRAVKRKIRANNGSKLAAQYGYFFVWRAADMELLEGFMQAQNKILGLLKFSLIVSEAQKWVTRAKEFISTLNDLTRELLTSPKLGDAKV